MVLPDAAIVIDRFHIARMVQNAVEASRKELHKPTTGKERAMLKNDRFVLLSRTIDLDVFQEATLKSWCRRWPVMEDVYDAKERFLDIWLAENKNEARYLYSDWKASVPEQVN
jgi:transposase